MNFNPQLEKQFDRGLFKRHIRYFEHRIYHIYNDIGDKSEYLIHHIRLKFSDSYILINGTYTVCKSVHTFFKTTNSTANNWFLPKIIIFVGYRPLNPGTMTYIFNNSIIFDYFRY